MKDTKNTKYKPIVNANPIETIDQMMEDFIKNCISKNFPLQIDSPEISTLMSIGKSVILTNITEKGNINMFAIEYEISSQIRQKLSEKYA